METTIIWLDHNVVVVDYRDFSSRILSAFHIDGQFRIEYD